jgi:hypothetical protein
MMHLGLSARPISKVLQAKKAMFPAPSADHWIVTTARNALGRTSRP